MSDRYDRVVGHPRPANTDPLHIENLNSNIKEVLRLVEIHAEMTGSGRGRRHNVATLNKSGIVLAVACWEAFVEDLASHAFSWLLARASTPAIFPRRVLTLASKELREAQDVRRVWELADDGWRAVLSRHKDKLLKKSVGQLNTPRTKQVDDLFGDLLGLAMVSSSWRWHNVANSRAKEMLEDLVTLRGEIAHRVTSSRSVTKRNVQDATVLVRRLAVRSSNTVRLFLLTKAPDQPWREFDFRDVDA